MRVTFRERMAGELRLDGDPPRQMELRLTVDSHGQDAAAHGHISVRGWPECACSGRMHIAPLRSRRIRYQLEFRGPDGEPWKLDGWKSVSRWHPVRSMTRLPVTLTRLGAVQGVAELRFRLRDLVPFLLSMRSPRWTS